MKAVMEWAVITLVGVLALFACTAVFAALAVIVPVLVAAVLCCVPLLAVVVWVAGDGLEALDEFMREREE